MACGLAREADIICDLAVEFCLADEKISLCDVINALPTWRADNDLASHSRVHEATAKQAYGTVDRFRAACRKKYERRVRLKKKNPRR